jgi:hypothetical protein
VGSGDSRLAEFGTDGERNHHNEFIEIFGLLTKSKTTQIAAASLAISIVFYAVVLVIFGLKAGSGGLTFPVDIGLTTRLALVGGFALVFVMLWFFLYVQNIREAEDVYSIMRDKLKGGWNIQYEATNGPDSKGLFDKPVIVPCAMVVNPGNLKLEITIDVDENPVWEGGVQTITNVSLRHDIGNRYNMVYYFKGQRKLKERANRYLIPDNDYSPSKGIEIEIFSILTFEDRANEKRVGLLEGEWYDLNGRITEVFALVDELKKEAAQRRESPIRKITDVVIDRRNFSARMGKISFKRMLT